MQFVFQNLNACVALLMACSSCAMLRVSRSMSWRTMSGRDSSRWRVSSLHQHGLHTAVLLQGKQLLLRLLMLTQSFRAIELALGSLQFSLGRLHLHLGAPCSAAPEPEPGVC